MPANFAATYALAIDGGTFSGYAVIYTQILSLVIAGVPNPVFNALTAPSPNHIVPAGLVGRGLES